MITMTSARAGTPGLARTMAGVDSSTTGYGSVAPTLRAPRRAGITIADIDRVERNQAFAAHALPAMKELGPLDRLDDGVGLRGGVIARWHPLGCSGPPMTTPLPHHMQERGGSLERLPTCIDAGRAIAAVFERD
jgi:acetyl-CoA acyltransferase